MSNNKFRELVENIIEIFPKDSHAVKKDIKDNLKILLEDYLKKMDIVTREEFDVQREVLSKTREKLEELEKKVK
tara:strand:- start:392 stop:613 length:222 start_codon:yes stop_codon:yes gene_type:complete